MYYPVSRQKPKRNKTLILAVIVIFLGAISFGVFWFYTSETDLKDEYLCRVLQDPKSSVIQLYDDTFHTRVASGIWLVELYVYTLHRILFKRTRVTLLTCIFFIFHSYAPWCPHCQRLAPIWEDTGKELTPFGINVARVDSTCEGSTY